MSKKLTPIFGRVGSKRTLKHLIAEVMPEDYDLFVEPFIGGGAIFLNTSHLKGSVINDKDEELISMWKLVQKGMDGNREDYSSSDLDQLKEWYYADQTTDMGRLVKFILKSSNTFGSMGKGKLYKNADPYKKLKKLDVFKEKLTDTIITSGDYRTVMEKHDSTTTFFYLDPPYSKAGVENGDNASKQLYKESYFSVSELVIFLKTIKGKWLVSLEDTPRIREMFKEYTFKTCTAGGTGNRDVGVNKRHELLIFNY